MFKILTSLIISLEFNIDFPPVLEEVEIIREFLYSLTQDLQCLLKITLFLQGNTEEKVDIFFEVTIFLKNLVEFFLGLLEILQAQIADSHMILGI
jgi:hypothetical protein